MAEIEPTILPQSTQIQPVCSSSSSPNSLASTLKATATAIITGIIFGFAFDKSRVFELNSIRGQMVFMRFVMLKMFLAAAGTNALVIIVYSKLKPDLFNNKVKEKYRKLSDDRSLLRGTCLGAAMLGFGMNLSSACPGMVLSQLGTGMTNSEFTFLGCVFGVMFYSLFETRIRAFASVGYTPPPETRFIEEYFPNTLSGQSRVDKTRFALAIVCYCVVAGLELLSPWDSSNEVDVNNTSECTLKNVFACRNWPPYIPGIIIGLINMPLLMNLNTCMGTGMSYQNAAALPFLLFNREKLIKKVPSLSYAVSHTPLNALQAWPIYFSAGAVVGAFASCTSTPISSFGTVNGLPPVEGFIGGFLMLFGSRMANGCTSGHGISGFPMLSIASFFAVPAMFTGGILGGFLLQAIMGKEVFMPSTP